MADSRQSGMGGQPPPHPGQGVNKPWSLVAGQWKRFWEWRAVRASRNRDSRQGTCGTSHAKTQRHLQTRPSPLHPSHPVFTLSQQRVSGESPLPTSLL